MAVNGRGAARPAKVNLTIDDPSGAIDDPQDRSRRDALATPALADDPERCSRRHIEADAINRFDGPFVLREIRLEIANGQERAIVHTDRPRPAIHRPGS